MTKNRPVLSTAANKAASRTRKVRPIHLLPITLSLMLSGLFAPATMAAPPPHSAKSSHTATAPKSSPHNTRNRNGRVTVVPIAKKKPVRPAPRVAAPQNVDYLLFCNQPERLSTPGAYADAKLVGGRTYRIFFHYRNVSRRSAPLTLAFHGTAGKKLTLQLRKGIADPQNDPPRAGRQALRRYLETGTVTKTNARGAYSLTVPLKSYDTASGILTVRASQDCRFRIFFDGGKRTVRGAQVATVAAPRREVDIKLNDKTPVQYFRIGRVNDLDQESRSHAVTRAQMDGSYGLIYAFNVTAPHGRKVRVTFSPRGGQSGLVALLNGAVRSSDIVPPAGLAVFAETTVQKNGFGLVTMPFGGVFYPVEIAFHLL